MARAAISSRSGTFRPERADDASPLKHATGLPGVAPVEPAPDAVVRAKPLREPAADDGQAFPAHGVQSARSQGHVGQRGL